MKLTAQFVARNGVQFLDKLMVREQVSEGRDRRLYMCIFLENCEKPAATRD